MPEIKRPPDKGGKLVEPGSAGFHKWAADLIEAGKRQVNTGSPNGRKSVSQQGTKERDLLFDSGSRLRRHLPGCGYSRLKTTKSKVTGGIIVKVVEIADEPQQKPK